MLTGQLVYKIGVYEKKKSKVSFGLHMHSRCAHTWICAHTGTYTKYTKYLNKTDQYSKQRIGS